MTVIPPGAEKAGCEPLLEALCALAPRLLRVDRIAPRFSTALGTARSLVLTLDRTVLEVTSDAGTPAIRSVDAGDVAGEGVNANEDEPWWSVLGAPLLGCWRVTGAGAGIALQLRDDASNPKIITIAADGDTLRATSEPKARWRSRIA